MEKQGNESSRDIEPEEVDTLASDNVPEPSAHETVSIPPRKTRRVRVGRIAGGGSSAVWTYFTKNSDKTSVCNLCGASHKHQNPGNLSKHLQWAHAKQYREFKKQTEEKRKVASPVTSAASVGIQTTLNFAPLQQAKCYKKNDLRYRKRTAAVTRLFAANSIPRRIVDSPEFANLMQILDPMYSPPSRHQLTNEISEMASRVKKRIIKRLEKVKRICVSTDIWTKKGLKESFLGVMAHLYDPYTHKIQRVLLAVRKITGSHTAELILDTVNTVLNDFEIPSKKVFHYITDSGSNVIAAFKRIVDIVEQVQEDVADNIESFPIPRNPFDPNLEEELSEEFEMPIENDFDSCESQHEAAFGRAKRLSCIAHKLVTVLKKHVDDDDSLKPIFEAAKSLIRSIRSSTRSNELLSELTGGKGLICPAITRWLYIDIVLERLLELRPEIEQLIEKRTAQLGQFELSRLQWKQIEAVCQLLKKFAIHTIEGDTYTTSSKVIPALVDLIEFCANDEDMPLSVSEVAENLRDGLEKKFDYILEPLAFGFQPIYAVATLLDPSFGHSIEDDLKSAAVKEIIRLVRREMECENQDVVMVQNQTSSSLKTGSMYGGFFKRKQLSVSDTHAASSGSVSLNRSIESKIEQYLEEISPLANAAPSEIPSPIQFWEMKLNTSLKELAELALDVMAIPATSAGMERGFSHCGIATAGRRHRLTAQNLENEIILRLNNDFMDV